MDGKAFFDAYLKAVRHVFARSKRQVDEAIAQLSDEELHHVPETG